MDDRTKFQCAFDPSLRGFRAPQCPTHYLRFLLRPAAGGDGKLQEIGYIGAMTKLLEKGIEAVRNLSAERQDMAGELLLSLAKAEAQYRLTPAQIEDVKLAMAEADRGEFATDSEMAETWKKFGR